MERYLEITLANKEEFGFYAEVKAPIGVEVGEWHKREGERIQGIQDRETLQEKGEVLLSGETTVKAEFALDAPVWAIGAILKKILLPAGGKRVWVDIRKEPMRFALLEVDDAKSPAEGSSKIQGGGSSEKKSSLEETAPPLQATPLAQEYAKDMGKILTPSEDGEAIRLADAIGSSETPQSVSESPVVMAAPATRVVARELGVVLGGVLGSGPHGIIREWDVKAFAAAVVERGGVKDVASSSPAPCEVSCRPDVASEIIEPTLTRVAIARNIERAWKAPHAGPGVDINPEPLFSLRERLKDSFMKLHGVKLRVDYFFVKACAWLLAQPEFYILNGRWQEVDGIPALELFKEINVGIAVAVPPGVKKNTFSELVIPVIRGADKKPFAAIAQEADKLVADAVAGKLSAKDQAGLTFTINNVGIPREWKGTRLRGTQFPSPVIAADTTALVAFGAVRHIGGHGNLMHVVLRFDHRPVDGYENDIFLGALAELLENPEQILSF